MRWVTLLVKRSTPQLACAMLGAMAQIRFGDGRELSIKIEQPNGLMKGAGLHRLQFPVEIDSRKTIGTGVPFALSGQAWLGPPGGDWLGRWFTDPNQPLVVHEDASFPATIVLPLTDEQLAVIEQRRAGGDVVLSFDVQAILGHDPQVATQPAKDHWPSGFFQQQMNIYAASWLRLLSQVNAGTSLAVVVPVPLDNTAAARVGSHLRDAIRKVNNSEYGDAATAARRAVEAVDDIHGVWPSESSVARIRKDERTLDQRLAMLRHSLHALASPSAHDDKVAAAIRWDREKALAVIAGVSALATCIKQAQP